MSILPQAQSLDIEADTESVDEPLKTYKLENNRIEGTVDGLDAIMQAVKKIVNTERFTYLVYDWNYGIEFQDLIGQDINYVIADLKRRFDEALSTITQIISLNNFVVVKIDGEQIAVSFEVETIYGVASYEEEIKIAS